MQARFASDVRSPGSIWPIVLSCLALLLLGGCGGGESTSRSARESTADEAAPSDDAAPANNASGARPSESSLRIGVSLLTVQHAFYQELRAGLEEEASRHGYQLYVTSGEFDAARQADQIDEFIVQKVDAIVVCPCDSRSVGASIVAANDARIPVFTADIASTSPLGVVVSHIASDNRAGGRKAAELMAAALGERGEVAILSHPTVASVTDRVAGFKERLADYPAMQVVAELSADGKRDRAVKVMEDILQSHPDLDGVFGINDDSALGALAAVEAAGRADRVAIVGYDATPEARGRIDAGAIYGDVIQNPRLIGQLTVQAIHTYVTGGQPDAVVPVAVDVYTGEGGE